MNNNNGLNNMKNIEAYIMTKPLTNRQAMIAVAVMIALEAEKNAKAAR